MWQFGSAMVDADAREVARDGEVQHLEPQAFDLLVYLVEHRDRVVPKAELLDEVWGDQFVSESALTTRIKEIRRATGDDGRTQAVIKNVRGRGYRFVAELSDPVPAPAEASGPDRRRRPPQPPTPSVGLDAEIDRLAELTEVRRLITIVGPGGVGKTRLALEVGRAVARRHALGTRVVELSRVSEPEAIRPAVRRALDLTEAASELVDELGAIDALLVLDNCEHIIDAVAAEVPPLLAGGDRLHVLATSREPLSVPGEQRWALAPLSTVGTRAPASAFFVDRARDVGVEIDPEDPLAGAIVDHLDGIPLAMEMAAARLATMGLADLADEVGRSIGSLRAGPRGVAERHSTLRAVLAWSEALLTPDQRWTLADFSVFAGPVDATDLPGVVDAADPVGAVCELAERSLVTVATTGRARARYGSLETIRQFGRERLEAAGRLDLVRHRHATWFTEAAERAAATYDTVDQPAAVARVDAVLDELRAAHTWARGHDLSLAMRLSHALFEPAVQELRLEVFDWSMALAQLITSEEDAAQLSAEIAQGLTLLGRLDEGREWAERSIAAAADPMVCRTAYATLGDIALYEGDLEQSVAFTRRYDDLIQRGGTGIERALSKASLALAVAYQGRHQEALEIISTDPPEDAPPIALAWLAYGRGEVLLDTDADAAQRELDTAISLAESVNGHLLGGVAHVSAASLRVRTGHAEDAIVPLRRTIERLADRGNLTHLLTTLRNLPTLLIRLEEWDSAAEVLGGLSRSSISPTYGDEADRLADAERATRSTLREDDFATAHRRGAERTLAQTARHAVTVLHDLSPVADG